MAMAQTVHDGDGVVSMPCPDISHAFILAVSLHVIGVLLLGLAIRYWPAVTPIPVSARVDLDLAVPPAPTAPVPEPSALDRALAAVSSETRPVAVPVAPVPEARPAGIPEPAMAVSPIREYRQSETFQIPDSLLLEVPHGRARRPAEPMASGDHPIALSQIQPSYPYSARIRGEAGKVTIHLRVTRQGEVESVAVTNSSGFPALDKSALVAARKARFKPAEKDGQPVSADMDLQFDFCLQD